MPVVQNKADIGEIRDYSLDDGQFAIVPSDTVDLPQAVQAIYVGGAGDITYLTPDRRTLTLKATAVGTRVHLDAVRVLATGTTATLLIGQAFKRDR